IGPVRRVSGASAQLVLRGDNPDVASLIMEHECGAISNLTASYASASEYYMMNVYGKEASAYYDLFGGLRHLRRGEAAPRAVAIAANDTIREELDEFAACIRDGGRPETDGWWASRNLAVVLAGVQNARAGGGGGHGPAGAGEGALVQGGVAVHARVGPRLLDAA